MTRRNDNNLLSFAGSGTGAAVLFSDAEESFVKRFTVEAHNGLSSPREVAMLIAEGAFREIGDEYRIGFRAAGSAMPNYRGRATVFYAFREAGIVLFSSGRVNKCVILCDFDSLTDFAAFRWDLASALRSAVEELGFGVLETSFDD